MKSNIYLISALLVAGLTLTNSVNAQWTHSGTVTYLNNTGDKVGIGTTTPTNKLEIRGGGVNNLLIKSTNNNAGILIDKGATNKTASVTYRTNGTSNWQTGCLGDSNYTLKNTSLAAAAIFCNATNNRVGIGTTTTPARLSVANTSLAGIGTTGSIQVGGTSTYNLVMDNNEVQARNNGTASALYLQYWGGDVNLCSSGGTANFYGPVTAASSLAVTGKVGIGTTTPSYDLHITSTDYSAGYIISPYNGGTVLNVIASGTTAGTWGLYSYATTLGYAAYFSGNIYCTGSYQPSDERLKENIMPLQNALDKVMMLNVKTYNFKSGLAEMNLPTERQYGFTAQNLESVFPELVKLNPAKKEQPLEFKAVNYIGMIPILTEAMQEQQKQIEAKDKAINNLQTQLDELKQSVQSIGINTSLKNNSSFVSAENSKLFQNQPNPFNQSTVIRYALSSTDINGVIIIRDLSGNLVKTFAVNHTGNGMLTVNANEITHGTYTYSLEIAGEIIDTKLMVITR